jgi:hypothetical protein
MAMGFRTVGRSKASKEASLHVARYLALHQRGRQPDLACFLSRIPQHLQEEVYQAIDAALANPSPQTGETYLVPQVEVVVKEGNRSMPHVPVAANVVRQPPGWLKAASLFVPRPIRAQLVGEILAMREEMREQGAMPNPIRIASVRELLKGVAQHAPLRPLAYEEGTKLPPDTRPAQIGWWSWRLSGPVILAGLVLGSGLVLAAGVLLCAGAFAGLYAATVRGTDLASPLQARLQNAVLGGSVVVLAVAALFGLLAVAGVGLAAAVSNGWPARIGMEMLVFAASATACMVSLTGWAPETYFPNRLVRV